MQDVVGRITTLISKELRGKIYKARKEVIQDKWKKELGYEVY